MTKLAYILGITVCSVPRLQRPHFYERHYFYQLTQAGRKVGLAVVIFDPRDINWLERTVHAWSVTSSKQWIKQKFRLPSLIYDRCYYGSAQEYLRYKPYVQRLAKDPQIRLLGKPLQGKYQTYQILAANKEIAAFLPETREYQTGSTLVEMLQTYKAVCLKPNGGSHGRGVIAIESKNHIWRIRGRTLQNIPFQKQFSDLNQVRLFIQRLIGRTRYVIQPYLSLTTSDGSPFDLRVLLQKNAHKEWQKTGVAIRIGNPISITSNLHGGGRAKCWEKFLQEHLPSSLHESIVNQLHQCTTLVPKHLEEYHGSLVELGLDLGIDQQGNVWILEANSKPGRSVFVRTQQLKTHQDAINQPIYYARALLRETKEVHVG
ncbi:YheC/D like ATP-grasp [Seinonella peptonophila]|uniref:YheC/D like ATP-grasp n=1 Tax=Seinonella peptonophila TaxID=112248 RepID=A0A1M4W514_9BACL|nr:YheC/YheD family protein [Seinonella peptonophila]SHE76230.1 YheC/D like ATP-grasp [Seinonella peptonophila]